MTSFSDTIVPKSDQLNADDLLTGPITVTVVRVSRGDGEQPMVIGIDGGRNPYKPCKSMRRVILKLWGDNGDAWIGRRMTLYCDPEVKWAGERVGGIRISHMSGLAAPVEMALTTTRGKRKPFVVQPLADLPPYPAERFDKNMATWQKSIADGKLTVDGLLAKIESVGTLTDEQRAAVEALTERTHGTHT